MKLIAKPSQTVEVAELLARLAKAEQIAREEHGAADSDPARQQALEGEISGLQQAARMTRELADWPVEADSERGPAALSPLE